MIKSRKESYSNYTISLMKLKCRISYHSTLYVRATQMTTNFWHLVSLMHKIFTNTNTKRNINSANLVKCSLLGLSQFPQPFAKHESKFLNIVIWRIECKCLANYDGCFSIFGNCSHSQFTIMHVHTVLLTDLLRKKKISS